VHLVLFDIDGTLVDSAGFDGQLFVDAVRAVLGIEIDADWSRYRHVTDSGILEEILDGRVPTEERAAVSAAVERTFVELTTRYLAELDEPLGEIPGACAFVRALQAHPKVSIGLATGGWRETARLKLSAIGLRPDEICLASASDARSREEIMSVAEARALEGRRASRKTYFGDAPWDRSASRALGYEFIAIGSGVDHATRFADFRAAETILAELRLLD
jgi:beta-phosphoglucomutase-like phosphatase (HAD superfamily)